MTSGWTDCWSLSHAAALKPQYYRVHSDITGLVSGTRHIIVCVLYPRQHADLMVGLERAVNYLLLS